MAEQHRLVHELEVHQIELEMQNAELREAQETSQRLLERFTDLFEFAPVGYFTLNGSGMIQEANLTVTALLGLDRSRLVRQDLARFVAPTS
ncbi:MAG TPA: histidine kinase, partial [Planctomycetes bacterium]|nr:histidine kinase [Planctomycetota bacterium]